MSNASRSVFILFALFAVLTANPAESETNEELAIQVRAAETAFANTMAARDHESFLSHR